MKILPQLRISSLPSEPIRLLLTLFSPCAWSIRASLSLPSPHHWTKTPCARQTCLSNSADKPPLHKKKPSLPISWAQPTPLLEGIWACGNTGQCRQKTPGLFLSHTVFLCYQTEPRGKYRCKDTELLNSRRVWLGGEEQLPGCLGCEKAKQPVQMLLPGYEGSEEKNTKQPIDLALVVLVSKRDHLGAHI